MPNRLATETSPYLLQHAHNPVDWYPWGEEAFAKAKAENKPVLVSIGYAACHWCHVMERESFENEETAALMNEHFVNIKVDREERPDVDHIYMDAVQAISGSGGWPLNAFLTPDGKPFYGGTYFPPRRAFNRASWTEVLTAIARSFAEKRDEIDQQAAHLTEHLHSANAFGQSGTNKSFGEDDMDAAFNNVMKPPTGNGAALAGHRNFRKPSPLIFCCSMLGTRPAIKRQLPPLYKRLSRPSGKGMRPLSTKPCSPSTK